MPTSTAQATDTPSEALVDHIDHFQRRVLQDALADATAAYWHRRAAVFEDARPRPDDYAGQATAEDLAAADKRCAAVAEGCRVRGRSAIIQHRELA